MRELWQGLDDGPGGGPQDDSDGLRHGAGPKGEAVLPAQLPEGVGEQGGYPWYVYMLRCGDGSLYTGITTDVPRRLRQHRAGRGARYTRGRGPLTLVYLEGAVSKGAALRRESNLKAMEKVWKEKLAAWGGLLNDGYQQP